MKFNISYKLGLLFFLIIAAFFLGLIFIITPQISNYIQNNELKSSKSQLKNIASIIEARAQSVKTYETHTLEDYKENIKQIAKISLTILEESHNKYLLGDITKDEAINLAFSTISKIEYGHENDYVFILNSKGDVLLHPDKQYQNKNIYYQVDYNGELFIGDLIKSCVSNKNKFTKYVWNKANTDTLSEKIVYSLYFKPLDMIISTGVYIDDIKKEVEKEKNKIINNLREFLSKFRLAKTGYIYIIDNENNVIIHPNKDIEGKNVSMIRQAGSKYSMVENLKKAYDTKQLWRYTWDKPGDIGNYSYKKISDVLYNNYFGWYIVSSIYEEDFKKDAKELQFMIISISLVLFLLLFIIGFWIIYKIVKPIKILSKDALSVKDGDFSVRNKIDSSDEVGILAKQFNFMLDKIENNINNLENSVELRTNEIKYKLYYDELTNIKNRYALIEELKKEEFASLVLLDICAFDDINELYGFAVGNELLKETTKILQGFCDNCHAELFRVHGNTFAFLFKGMVSDLKMFDSFLIKIDELLKNRPIHIKSIDIEVFISMNIGISICQEHPLKSANIALKEAKSSSKFYCVYNHDIDSYEKIKKSLYWREELTVALKNDKVIPFFQPIVNAEGEIIKYETLMRIESENEKGEIEYLSPYLFLEIALKTRQYEELTKVIVTKAIKMLSKTNKMITVNLGFEDIQNPDFSRLLDRLLKNLKKEECSRFVFEILESEVISDYAILENFISKYRKKGIKIAIDDFGTGYSNFEHILNVRPDYLKIDGSLIKDIHIDNNAYELVKSIVVFSKALNMNLIAEFVHCEEVFNICKDLGINEFQGFYFGTPEAKLQE